MTVATTSTSEPVRAWRSARVPETVTCTAPRHGTEAAYSVGCRCPSAKEEKRLARKRRRFGLRPPQLTDATGACRRLRALACLGYTPGQLAVRLRLHSSLIIKILSGRHVRVHVATWQAVVDGFEQLSGTPGQCRWYARRALKRGWLPPLEWEGVDMDDPAASPVAPAECADEDADVDWVAVERAVSGRPVQLSPHEKRVAAERMWGDLDLSADEIARRIDGSRSQVLQLGHRRNWPRRTGHGRWRA